MALDEHESIRITFRCTWLHRVFSVFLGLAVTFVCALIAAAVMWVGLPALFWQGISSPPQWWHIIAGSAVIAVGILAVRSTSRLVPTRLILTEHCIEIGGRLFRRRIPYGRIRIVQLKPLDQALDKSVELGIVPDHGPRATFAVRADDAPECWYTIHQLSDAAAIDIDDMVYTPANPEFVERGREDAARVFRRRERRSWLVAAGLLLYSAFAVAALIFWATPPHRARAWFWVIVGPITTLAAVLNALRNRQLALGIRNAAIDIDEEDE